MPLGELLLYGFLVNRGMVVIGAIYGLLWQLDVLDRVWSRLVGEEVTEEGVVRELIEGIAGGAGVSLYQAAVAAAAVLGFLIVVRLASMCWAVVRLYGFRLTAVGEDLRIEYGLLTRFTATIPVRRIQSVTITEGPLYRLLDRVSVRIETAGGRTGQETAASAREWLAPLIQKAGLLPLLAEVMGDDLSDGKTTEGKIRNLQFTISSCKLRSSSGGRNAADTETLTDWMPVHPRAFHRAVKRRLFVAFVLVLVAAAAVGWRGLLMAAVAIPWSVLAARRHVEHLGWTASGTLVAFRSGWLWRSVTMARVSRVQAVTLVESPFDRRASMARVRVDTAGANERSHRIDIPYLARDHAAALQLRLAAQAADQPFHW
jgi:putative membrane protein